MVVINEIPLTNEIPKRYAKLNDVALIHIFNDIKYYGLKLTIKNQLVQVMFKKLLK